MPLWKFFLAFGPIVVLAIHFAMETQRLKKDNDRLRNAVIDHNFPSTFDEVVRQIHANAVRHGFWPTNRNKGETIALIHSEASELLAAVRLGHPSEDEMDECADIVIRVMDYAHGYYPGLSLGDAIVTKYNHNISRPAKHGKRF